VLLGAGGAPGFVCVPLGDVVVDEGAGIVLWALGIVPCGHCVCLVVVLGLVVVEFGYVVWATAGIVRAAISPEAEAKPSIFVAKVIPLTLLASL
jgi:hypothetical protein